MTTLLVLAAIVAIALFFVYGCSKLANNGYNAVRSVADNVGDALGDPVRDAGYAIVDAEKERNQFQSEIHELITANNEFGDKVTEARDEEAQYAAVAKKINATIQGGDTSEQTAKDLDQAISLAKLAAGKAESYERQIRKNDDLKKSLLAQLDDLNDKISEGKTNKVALSAELAGETLRKKQAQAAATASTGRGVAALDRLAEAVKHERADANAWEELASHSTEGKAGNLLKKYATDKGVTDADRAKYLS